MNNQTQAQLKSTEFLTHSGEVINLTKDIVKKYISPNSDVTDQEFAMFFQLCKVQKLNPFLKEAYLIKFGTSPAQIITDYKVLQQIADRNKEFNGVESGIMVEDENGEIQERKGSIMKSTDTLIGGWCKVYRKDREYPFHNLVSIKEFGKTTATWKSMPAFMIEKVAKAHAFRVAFPQEMQGVYTEEEMVKNDNVSRINEDTITIQEDPIPKQKTLLDNETGEVTEKTPKVINLDDLD